MKILIAIAFVASTFGFSSCKTTNMQSGIRDATAQEQAASPMKIHCRKDQKDKFFFAVTIDEP